VTFLIKEEEETLKETWKEKQFSASKDSGSWLRSIE
jgi:hypothetical protein